MTIPHIQGPIQRFNTVYWSELYNFPGQDIIVPLTSG